MTWLHTWTGLILGWLLFAVFVTGTLAFFQFEITRWMQPELTHPATPANAVSNAQAFLLKEAPDSPRWSIGVPGERDTVSTLFWRASDAGPRGFKRATLDGTGQEVSVRETRGGNFLYRFHFDLHYMPVIWARWLVSIAAMCMFIALISGIIIHKKIFKDFFTFKSGMGMRSWLDAHTLTSVLAVPFHLMITYTGLVTLMLMIYGWAMNTTFGDRGSYFEAVEARQAQPAASGIRAEPVNLQTLFDDAQQRLGGAEITFIGVDNPTDQNGTIEFMEVPTNGLISPYRRLVYSTATGELLSTRAVPSVAEQTRRTMINLHAGRFADWPLRWLYFISGITGSVMIATGLVLWSKKREKKAPHKGHQWVRVLNAATIMGLPFAVASFFIANRILPETLADRAQSEIDVFFAGWFIVLVMSLLTGEHRRWRYSAMLNAVTFLLLPLLSVVTVAKHIGTYQFPEDSILLVMDICLLVTGCLFLLQWKILNRKHHQAIETEVGHYAK